MRLTGYKASIVVSLCLLSAAAFAQAQNLQSVLDSMDRAAANFHSAQCDFNWDQYQSVVEEHDNQSGVMYFRRQGNNVEMAADITTPARKYVLFSGDLVSVYEPGIDQVTQYNPGKHKGDIESFLVLGFGGSGADLQKSFDLRLAGLEQAQGINAAKLELTPKSQRVRNMFSTITLWIDPARGVSVQQKFQEPSGDYRLTKYSNIQLNKKIPGDVFKLKTTGKTKFIKPNS